MTAVSRSSALVLAVVLAAATAAADTVVTDKEVIRCRVISCDTISIRLEVPSGGTRTFYTRDVREIRLSDSSRVAEVAVLLPRTKVTADSGQAVPIPEVRAESVGDRRTEAKTGGSLTPVGTIDTLLSNAQPAQMIERCREMEGALLKCGQNTDAIVELLRDVEREEAALRRIWPYGWALCLPVMSSVVPWGSFGAAVGNYVLQPADGGCVVGSSLGGAAVGAALGKVIGEAARRRTIVAHRERVNALVRRVNRVVPAEPCVAAPQSPPPGDTGTHSPTPIRPASRFVSSELLTIGFNAGRLLHTGVEYYHVRLGLALYELRAVPILSALPVTAGYTIYERPVRYGDYLYAKVPEVYVEATASLLNADWLSNWSPVIPFKGTLELACSVDCYGFGASVAAGCYYYRYEDMGAENRAGIYAVVQLHLLRLRWGF